ncbi:MAG: hypothetical protein IJP70_03140 [Bacteroidales bacterium]|nr:hypothetical protein [Bacteroidales bacterium]
MRQAYSERFYLNRAGENAPQTVRLTLRMDGAVNGQILSEAVADTQKRYPYLCVRLCTYKDGRGCEHAAFEDNPLPWVVSGRREPLRLMGSETNRHLLAFAWWDDCIAFDFFHAIMDGEAAYRVLRTLLYEYCRRRYDSRLSAEGVWTAGSPVSEEEWTDPATMPRPELQSQQTAPNTQAVAAEMPKVVNIAADPIASVTDRHEVVHIVTDEVQMMATVRACHGTPAVWLSLLLNKAVARLHPDRGDAVPTVVLAVNLRKALGTPLSHHALVGGIMLPLNRAMQDSDVETQIAEMRRMVTLQTAPARMQAYFWQTFDRMNLLEQMPTLASRHQAMSQVTTISRQYGSATLSYVGRANMGAAEQYVRELRTESGTPYLISLQVAAAGGKFCLSFMQQFATDVYLNAFLEELQRQGITFEITGRHPMEIAPIAEFRT